MTEGERTVDIVDQLTEELLSCRQRGVEWIDLRTHNQEPLELPELQSRAERYAQLMKRPLQDRVAQVKRLLWDGLEALEADHPAESKLIGDLLFGDSTDTVHERAGALLSKAMKARDEVDQKRFQALYRRAFEVFAGFLVEFEDVVATKRRRRYVYQYLGAGCLAVALVVAIVLIANLPGGGGDGTDDLDGNPTQTTELNPPPTETLVFDALGGTPPIIRVFPGMSDSPQDKVHNGTFNDGEATPAVCKTKGRTVSSDPTAGDRPRTSDDWIRIKGSPGLTQYATAVYVRDPEVLLAKLPNC